MLLAILCSIEAAVLVALLAYVRILYSKLSKTSEIPKEASEPIKETAHSGKHYLVDYDYSNEKPKWLT